MQQLDYWELLNPYPVRLPFGTIRKPTLSEMASMTFNVYIAYEILIGGDPEALLSAFKGSDGKAYWSSLPDDKKITMTAYKLIMENEDIQQLYIEALNFFFVEEVVFLDGNFVLFKRMPDDLDNIQIDELREIFVGLINEEMFPQVLAYLQQICCIYEKEDTPLSEIKFKNELAKRIYIQTREAEKERLRREARMNAKERTIANIISAVSNRHPSLSPTSIWTLTKFQLIDSFNRLKTDAVYEITSTRVAVWGDEKKQFDDSLWYKNTHDE